MADGTCDWAGCESTYVQTAIVRLHEHDDARPHDDFTDEKRFELCVPHAHLLVQFITDGRWAETTMDPEGKR